MSTAQVLPIYYYNGRGPSPLRAVLQWAEPTLALFNPATRNRILRLAGIRVGLTWRATKLRKRFNKATLARPPFNYHKGGATPMFGRHKKGDPAKMVNAIYHGRVTCRVAAKTAMFRVAVGLPKGHPVPPEITAVFLTATPDEVKEIAANFKTAIEKILSMGGGAHLAVKVAGVRKPKHPMELNWRQRRAIGMKPRRAA